VAFGLRRHTNLSEEELKKVVTASLERVGLREIGDLLPYELSGGMKKGSAWPGLLPMVRKLFCMMNQPPVLIQSGLMPSII